MGFTKDGGDPRIISATHHDNFISEFQTNLKGEELINYYEYITDKTPTKNRVSNNGQGVSDESVFLHELPPEFWHDTLSKAVYRAWCFLVDEALNDYGKKYDVLVGRPMQHQMCKLQKTLPGQGFHNWHYEATPNTPYRVLTTQLYINDDYEGGETEFLYQHCRVKPEEGKFTISPTAWTHTHRGNPPLNGTKYIATAWVEEFPSQQHK